MEREFRFKTQMGISEVFPIAWAGLDDSKYIETDGRINAQGIEQLKRTYSHVNWQGFEANPTVDEIKKRETVGSLVKYIEGRLS